MVPICAAGGTVIFTWLGMTLYSDQLAKISVGSMLKKKGAVPVGRKGSVAQLVADDEDNDDRQNPN